MRVCLYVLCGHLLVSAVSLSLSHWYPGSGVVLDCIDSWSLHPYLLCTRTKHRTSSEARTSDLSSNLPLNNCAHLRVMHTTTTRTLYALMNYSLWFDTINMEWSIVYICHILQIKSFYMYFFKDCFCVTCINQLRHWWNVTWCGFSSRYSLLAKVPT